jgi:spore maturation protein B
MIDLIRALSVLAVPAIIVTILIMGVVKKVRVYEQFVDGAKEGFTTAVRIIPYLVAMLCAIGMFRASGAMDFLTELLAPVTALIGMPSEVFPMSVIRSLSGSGSLGIMTDLAKTYGPDSIIARMAAVIMGSNETTFYVLAVYFGSVGITRVRHAPLSGVFADIISVITTVIIVRAMFS